MPPIRPLRNGLPPLYLLLLLTGCAATEEPREPQVRTEVRRVEVPAYIRIPDSLTRDCDRPSLPAGTLVNDDLVEHVEQLETALDICSNDKAAIRRLQPAAQ